MAVKNKGFHISIDTTKNVIKIRLWGQWDVELGKEYLKELKKQIKGVNENKNDWFLLMDLTEYLPQSQKIQSIIGEGLVLLKADKFKKKAVLVDGKIIHLPIESLSREPRLQIYCYFQSEDDAVQWLLTEVSSL